MIKSRNGIISLKRRLKKNILLFTRYLVPVCRPGWLVEVECIAIKQVSNKKFAAF